MQHHADRARELSAARVPRQGQGGPHRLDQGVRAERHLPLPGERESGVDYDEAKKLAEKARIEEVLQCTKLGGKREWKLDEFLDEDVWEELGGKAGLRPSASKPSSSLRSS